MAEVDIDPETVFCGICGAKMQVRKTVKRSITTLRHNSIRARERVMECPLGCKWQDGSCVISREPKLAALAPPGSNYGYDVEVFIGISRYVNHLQREEILSVLKEQYAVSVSSGEACVLADRFLSHLEALHESRSDEIRAALSKDGGYPLHIDATTEGGRGTLFVAFAGWRRWVLGAWKIPSESAEAITPHISETCKNFGDPLAIVRDLGAPMAKAANIEADNMPCRPRILACHYHFLQDVGKGLLDDDHEFLRKLARKVNIREKIRVVIRELRKKTDPETTTHLYGHFDCWLNKGDEPYLPGGAHGMSLVIALSHWVLDYQNDGKSRGFPFDCPYHNLYRRCKTVDKAIDVFLSQTRFDRAVDSAMERLKKAVRLLLDNKDARKTVKRLEMYMELFDKLRKVFRLETELLKKDSPNNINLAGGIFEEGDSTCTYYAKFEENTQEQVSGLAAKLRQSYESENIGHDLKRGIKILLDHLEKHGPFLWGHLLEVETEGGIKLKLVDRTNNALESFFHKMKHGERRRSGHKILTRDFENIKPAAALAMNLADPGYIQTVCGSIENLPLLFSEIDQKQKVASRQASDQYDTFEYAYDKILSRSDKSFVRKESVNLWLLAAANDWPVGYEPRKRTKAAALTPLEEMDRFLAKTGT